MSNKVTKMCRPLVLSAATQKCVLMALADRADDSGASWPSITWLCMWTGFKRTAVIEAVKKLEQAGIVVVRKKIGSNNNFDIDLARVESMGANQLATSPAYGLVEDEPEADDQSVSRTGAAEEPVRLADYHPSVSRTPTSPSGEQTSPSGGPNTLKTPIKTPIKQKRERSKKISVDADAMQLPPWLPAESWAMWNRHRAGKRKVQTADSVKLQLRKLEDFVVNGHDAAKVIEYSVCAGWDSLYAARDGSTLAAKATPLDGKGNELPACPVQTIVDLYHAALPGLPQVLLMPEARKAAISQTWSWVLTSVKTDGSRRAETPAEAEDWFRSYFERASMNDYLMGRTQRSGVRSDWQCDLDHLLTDKGKTQVIEKTQERLQELFI